MTGLDDDPIEEILARSRDRVDRFHVVRTYVRGDV
jgi:hypothetical protein